MKNWLLHIVLLVVGFAAYGQKGNDLIKEGNKLYEKGDFSEAEMRYRKAEEEKGDAFISKFNLGDVLFKQERFEEAAAAFQQLPSLTEDKQQKAAAYHNLGNSLMKMEKYKESVDAYKQALRHDPKDEDTKYNLSYARRMIQEQEEQQDQNQDKDDNKEEKEDKQNQQQQQDKGEEDDKKDDQQQQPQDQQGDQQEQEQQQPKENEISREDAERMLDALNQEERDIRERLEQQQKRGPKRKVERDW